MFDTTLELIAQAASNSLFVFCFCNMIIVMILMGSKPGSRFVQESEIPLSVVTGSCRNVKLGTMAKQQHSHDENRTLAEVSEVPIVKEPPPTDGENENSNDREVEAGDNDNEDDELRRRVEEFIDKINRGWKAELLKTSQFSRNSS